MTAETGGIVLGIAGHAKSGKTSLAKAISEKTGYPVASFGKEVERIAEEEGYPLASEAERRVSLMKLGERLVADQLELFCRRVLDQGNWHPGGALIVEGIRHADVIHQLRRLISPTPFYVVLVETSAAVREARLEKEGKGGPLTRATMDAHSTEREIGSAVALFADWIVSGEIDPSEAADQVLESLRSSS